jgi:acetyl-CoA decarbonylase/synthase, CODH/ACS complex subunit gamma
MPWPKLKAWNALQYERVGLNLAPGTGGCEGCQRRQGRFAKAAKQIAETSEFNLILMSENVDVMKAGVEAPGSSGP